MGLFGNLLVEPASATTPTTARRELPLILSDLLVDGDSLVPFGQEAPNFALMGRFGNVLLINGQPKWQLQAAPGEVVRLLLTNAASARTFNISFGDAPIKLVASDQGPYARETMVSSIVIAPGERYVADVRFDKPGTVAIVNEVQRIDHFFGEMYANADTHGPCRRLRQAGRRDLSFAVLHDDSTVMRDIARFRPAFDKAPDEEIVLTTAIQGLPIPLMQFMSSRYALPAATGVCGRHVGHELARHQQGGPVGDTRHPQQRGEHEPRLALQERGHRQDPRLQRPAFVPSNEPPAPPAWPAVSGHRHRMVTQTRIWYGRTPRSSRSARRSISWPICRIPARGCCTVTSASTLNRA